MAYNRHSAYENEDQDEDQYEGGNEEEENEEQDGQEDAGYDADETYNQKPMSIDVDNDELHDGGLMMMKLFMAQMFNEQKDEDEDEIHHSHIEVEEVDRHVRPILR